MMPSDLSVVTRDKTPAPTRMVANTAFSAVGSSNTEPTAPMTTFGTTVLKRDLNGHFFTKAAVNGIDVRFLVDTGASGVSLTVEDARAIGLQFDASEFDVIGSGASGPVRGKMIMLDRVSLDGRTVEQVQGAILEGGQMSLLGQSFLAQMGRIEIANDEMVIH
jgi:aspartyl protease family protein